MSIGQKVEDLLSDPTKKQWLSISTEFCGGTHISNTREAKAFALLSEEGIAKGIRRVTAVTTASAISAQELAKSLDDEITEASKSEGSSLEKSVASLKSRLDAAIIPAARKADLRSRISKLQVCKLFVFVVNKLEHTLMKYIFLSGTNNDSSKAGWKAKY